MPLPAKAELGQGRLTVDRRCVISLDASAEPRVRKAAIRFCELLSRQTGMPIQPSFATGAERAFLQIQYGAPGEQVQSVKANESYTLEVTDAGARLKAAEPLGVLRGLETLLQLVQMDAGGTAIPAVRIDDRPRFPWRGLLIDAARHWMPVEVILRNLDAMAAVKLNVLHWHLSDDQGFRVECRTFPNLHGMGSDGSYYTREQIREVLAYARDLGIRVMPEFDMPGHTTAWFVGHPELASGPGPYQIERKWGIFDPAMDPAREAVYEFLDRFVAEMAALFDDEYFHIGGDEVNGKQWNANPAIQAFKREKGMKNNHDLQAYFNQRLLKIVQKHGKKMIGWDEILHPTLPKDSVIHSWRGQKSLAQASGQGYLGILSSGYYLDHMLPTSQHYAVDPLGKECADLSEEQKARIMGGEACMWAEFVTPETIDSRIWPRMAAIAERFWSPANVVDVEDMYRRLDAASIRLGRLVTHRSNLPPMLERLADGSETEPLETLLSVLEPLKYYDRPDAREYTSFTPLNRAVDAARPESLTARRFANLVASVLTDASAADAAQARRLLSLWRDNHALLKPVIARAPMLKEVEGHSENLAALAEIGLEALDCVVSKRSPAPGWPARAKTVIERARKPQAELLNMLAAPVQKLAAAAR
jgi:hexosaminidase